MSIPYESATAGDRALAEIQRLLAKFGCQQFGTMIDAEHGKTLVQFRWRNRQISLEASWKGYAAAWQKAHPLRDARYVGAATRARYDQRALEIGKVAVCSVLRDWIKGQTTAIECGVLSFDAAFMPYTLLPSGERVMERVEASGMLPPVDEPKVVMLTKDAPA